MSLRVDPRLATGAAVALVAALGVVAGALLPHRSDLPIVGVAGVMLMVATGLVLPTCVGRLWPEVSPRVWWPGDETEAEDRASVPLAATTGVLLTLYAVVAPLLVVKFRFRPSQSRVPPKVVSLGCVVVGAAASALAGLSWFGRVPVWPFAGYVTAVDPTSGERRRRMLRWSPGAWTARLADTCSGDDEDAGVVATPHPVSDHLVCGLTSSSGITETGVGIMLTMGLIVGVAIPALIGADLRMVPSVDALTTRLRTMPRSVAAACVSAGLVLSGAAVAGSVGVARNRIDRSVGVALLGVVLAGPLVYYGGASGARFTGRSQWVVALLLAAGSLVVGAAAGLGTYALLAAPRIPADSKVVRPRCSSDADCVAGICSDGVCAPIISTDGQQKCGAVATPCGTDMECVERCGTAVEWECSSVNALHTASDGDPSKLRGSSFCLPKKPINRCVEPAETGSDGSVVAIPGSYRWDGWKGVNIQGWSCACVHDRTYPPGTDGRCEREPRLCAHGVWKYPCARVRRDPDSGDFVCDDADVDVATFDYTKDPERYGVCDCANVPCSDASDCAPGAHCGSGGVCVGQVRVRDPRLGVPVCAALSDHCAASDPIGPLTWEAASSHLVASDMLGHLGDIVSAGDTVRVLRRSDGREISRGVSVAEVGPDYRSNWIRIDAAATLDDGGSYDVEVESNFRYADRAPYVAGSCVCPSKCRSGGTTGCVCPTLRAAYCEYDPSRNTSPRGTCRSGSSEQRPCDRNRDCAGMPAFFDPIIGPPAGKPLPVEKSTEEQEISPPPPASCASLSLEVCPHTPGCAVETPQPTPSYAAPIDCLAGTSDQQLQCATDSGLSIEQCQRDLETCYTRATRRHRPRCVDQ